MLNVQYLLTYLLTPCSRVLLEKLTGSQLLTKFPTFYGTRRFVTAFTNARQLSLSWATSIQSIPPRPTSWKSVFLVSSHLRLGLPSGLFPSGSSPKTLYTLSSPPYMLHAPSCAIFHIAVNPQQYPAYKCHINSDPKGKIRGLEL